jgi:ribonuclease D
MVCVKVDHNATATPWGRAVEQFVERLQISTNTMQEIFVDTQQGLMDLCEQLRGKGELALDTEFLREKTYYVQLCLLQIASDELIACVDPLALDDLTPLLDIIYDPASVKVMHAGRQDLEIFYHLRGDLPKPIFDTQVAATLMGFGDQVGYAALVKAMQEVELDKSHTRTDWSQRPLDVEQLRYAADDVRYLLPIYRRQREILEDKQRLGWLQPDFNELTRCETYNPPVAELWKRVKGNQQVKGVGLAILQGLAQWREEQAQRVDRPRRWILKDEVMIDLSRRSPRDEEGLGKIRGLEAKTIQRHGMDLLAIISRCRQLPKEEWPSRPRVIRLTVQQDALVDVMMAVVRLRAAEHDVSPALLANRKSLEALVAGNADSPLLHGWRSELVGHDLQALLQGEATFKVHNGQLQLQQ